MLAGVSPLSGEMVSASRTLCMSSSGIVTPVIETPARIDPVEVLGEKRVQSRAYGSSHVIDLGEMPLGQTCL